MENKYKIQEIHKSELFGIIVEAGCGGVIANELYQIDGSSNTILFSEQPYSKEIQREKGYLPEGSKSISTDFIYNTTKKLEEKYPQTNFIITATFQLGGGDKLAHGWISYKRREWSHIYGYHFSIPDKMERTDYLKIIRDAGVEILYQFSQNNYMNLGLEYVDRIVAIAGINAQKVNDASIDTIQNLVNSKTISSFFGKELNDTFIVFTPKGIIRYEDFVRGKSGVILQKGSYNPIHQSHVDIFEKTAETYPEYAKAFLLSLDNRDKESIRPIEMFERILSLTNKGFTAIVCLRPMLLDTIRFHFRRWKNIPLILPIGNDTLIRFVDDEVKSLSTKFNLAHNFEGLLKLHFRGLADFNFKFEVFDRYTKLDKTNLERCKPYLDKICNFRKDYADIEELSSTKFRELKIKPEIHIKDYTKATNQLKSLTDNPSQSNYTINIKGK